MRVEKPDFCHFEIKMENYSEKKMNVVVNTAVRVKLKESKTKALERGNTSMIV